MSTTDLRMLARVSAAALALTTAPLALLGASTPAPEAPASVATAASAGGAATAGPDGMPVDPENDPLLKRVIDLTTAIKTYQAVIHADIVLHTFPFITAHVDGNVYFKAPDRQAVVFDTVPLLAGQLKKVYPNVPAPSRWSTIYSVASLGDDAGKTTYRLIPKKHGRVLHLDVRVDDAKATIETYTWTYEDGGDITFDQTFVMAGGHPVVGTQTGKVELPSYKADVSSTISGYKLNVKVDDSVFDEPK